MVKEKYIPEQGDIIFLDYESNTTGHEQKGRRPALVVSDYELNQFTKMAFVCPITNSGKEYPFRVSLSKKHKTTGLIMCEQMKACDFI